MLITKIRKFKQIYNLKTYLLVLIAFLLIINPLKAQSIITADPAYNTQVNSPTAGEYDISGIGNILTTNNDNTMKIHRFTRFDLAAGETANILLDGSMTSLNIVNGPFGTNIAGTLNSRIGAAGSPIGGNMVFIDTNGIVVTNTAIINTGSIMLSTSTQSIIPLTTGGVFTSADLNDLTQYIRFAGHDFDESGIINFFNPTGIIQIDGVINSSPASALFQTTPTPTFGTGKGIFLYGERLIINGTVRTDVEADIYGVTGRNLRWDLNNGVISSSIPFPNGSGQGEIRVNGNSLVESPSGFIDLSVNTLDITQNIINVKGIVSANAIIPDDAGGNINLRNIQQAGSQIIIDDTAELGEGIVTSTGNANGRGGSAFIQTSQLIINDGGRFDVKNDPNTANTGNGGTFVIQSLFGTNTDIGGAFLDPGTIGSINVAETATNPAATGSFQIYDNNGIPGIQITNPINFPNDANVRIFSYTGDIRVLTGGAGIVSASKDITLEGENLFIDGSLWSQTEDIILQSRTGVVTATNNADIRSLTGYITINRIDNNGTLTVNSDGTFSANTNFSPLKIGNFNGDDFTETSITLNGTTFGAHAGVYNAPENRIVDSTVTPGLEINQLELNLTVPAPPGPPPAPPAPQPAPAIPAPQIEAQIIQDQDINDNDRRIAFIDIEAINEDLVETETKQKNYNTTERIVDNNEISTSNEETSCLNLNTFDNIDVNQSLSVNGFFPIGEMDLSNTMTFCCQDKKIQFCGKYTTESAGDFLVSVLLKGYPFIKEYSADNYGLKYSLETDYHPNGLIEVLKSFQALEDFVLSKGYQPEKNPIINYKHPPINIRIQKLQDEVTNNKLLDDKIYKVNSKRFLKFTKKVK